MKDDKDNQNMEFKEAKDLASFAPLSITVSGENENKNRGEIGMGFFVSKPNQTKTKSF